MHLRLKLHMSRDCALVSHASRSPAPSASSAQNEQFTVEFMLPQRNRISMRASNKLCVNEIKEALLNDARAVMSQSRRMTEERACDLLRSPDDYCLKVVGIDEYITVETLPLQRVDFVQVCSKAFLTPKFEMIPRSQMKPKSEVCSSSYYSYNCCYKRY